MDVECPVCCRLFNNGRGLLNHFRFPDDKHSEFLEIQKKLVATLYDTGHSINRIGIHKDFIFSHNWAYTRIKEMYSHDEIKRREKIHRSENNCMKTDKMRKYFSKLAKKQFEDEEQRNIRSITAKRLWQTPEWRNEVMSPKLMSERTKQAFINNPSLRVECRKRIIKTRQTQPTKTSLIELKMKNELINRNVDFIHEFVYNMGIADFLIKPNIIVECDGDYWHNIPKVKARDEIKNQYLETKGYQVFRFWEHEINADIVGCVDKIQQSGVLSW